MSPATRYRPILDAAVRHRAVVNTLNLTTPLGLLLARAGRAAVRRGPDGLWLAEGYRLGFPVAGAFTVGNVVLTASDIETLQARTPGMLGHESRHAAQYERWGLAFLPLYALAASWSWLRYRDPAVGNAFEREAGLVTGFYVANGCVRPEPLPWRAALGAAGRRGVRRTRGSAGGGPSGPPAGGRADAGAA